MRMEDWIEVPVFTKAPPGRGNCVSVRGKYIALFCVKDQWFAIDDSCPHAGASLARGTVDGCLVKCPSHGMRFDLRDGCMPGVPDFGVKVYPVKEDGGKLFVALKPAA